MDNQDIDNCPECGEKFEYHTGTETTLVGYCSPPGHDHDDNCQGRYYVCPNGHVAKVYKRNICPADNCDWKGKLTCFCHDGDKIEEWPDAPFKGPRPERSPWAPYA